MLDRQLCLQNYIIFDPPEEFPFCINTSQLKKKKNQSQSRNRGRMRLVFTIDFDSGAALHAVCRLLKCCEQDFGQLLPSLKFHGASISFFCLLSQY